MYGPHMGMPYLGAAPSEYMGHPGDYAAVPHHPHLAEGMRGPRPSKKQKRSGAHIPPIGAAAVAGSTERKVKQEAEGGVGGRPAEGTADDAFLDILSFDDVDRFFVDEANECTPVVDGRTGREVPDAPQIPHDHCAQQSQTQQPARGYGEEEGETEGWFVGGWGLDESAEAESEVDVEPLEGSPTAGDASGATSESAAALNPPKAQLGKRPRAEDVFGSNSGGPAAEGVDAEGGMAVKLGSRKELQQQSPSLRLNYEDVISAWSDQAPEGQSPWIEQEEEEGASAEKRDGLNRPLLANLPGLATASPSLPGCAQDTDVASPGEQWGEQQHEQQPAMDSDTFELFSNEGREARVMRYREKRRNRLYSKKIRYEVRKVNADQRPRVKGEEVLELMRMGEGGGMDDMWTDDEARTWSDAGRDDWSDAEDWGAAEEWRVRDAWGEKEKWGGDKELNGREEWGDTENWRAGADRERLAFAEQQQAGLPYAVGLASVQQPLDLLWADELSGGQWDGGGEMMGESTGLMGLESVGERQREEGGDGEGGGRKKREKGAKVKVVDLGRLKEKLEGFCEEQGLEPGTMPTRGILRAARRSDIEKEIQFAGGVHAVAQKLNMQVARKTERGRLGEDFEKWGGLHEVARMLDLLPRFKRPRNPRSGKTAALEKQAEEEVVEGKANSVVTSASSGEEAEWAVANKREKAKKDYPGQVLIRHPQPPPPTMLLPVGAGSIEAKFAAQHGEIQQLLTENQRLAATHVALRQELAAAQGEIQRTKATLAAVQMEKDQAVRGIMEHKAKLEADLRAVEPLRGELHRARMELQALQARGGEAEAGRAEMQRQMSAMGGDMQRMRSDLEGMRQELMQARNMRALALACVTPLVCNTPPQFPTRLLTLSVHHPPTSSHCPFTTHPPPHTVRSPPTHLLTLFVHHPPTSSHCPFTTHPPPHTVRSPPTHLLTLSVHRPPTSSHCPFTAHPPPHTLHYQHVPTHSSTACGAATTTVRVVVAGVVGWASRDAAERERRAAMEAGRAA
ncbi:unnamed protein product [Closterium sp. NIES-64]|nr:unnamed protein product [Closterium sp. NIES-64]